MCVCVCLHLWVCLHEQWINIVYLFGVRVFSLDCWDGQWPVFLCTAKIDSHSGQPLKLVYLQNTHTAYVHCCQGNLCAHIRTKVYENAPFIMKLQQILFLMYLDNLLSSADCRYTVWLVVTWFLATKKKKKFREAKSRRGRWEICMSWPNGNNIQRW